MIRFLLNQKEVKTNLPAGMALLDFIRYHKHLTGTKIGCREGDCGACTVLTGEIIDNELVYRSATCCLMALGNAHGKHIVTVEGLNMGGLNPIQQAMCDESATQCGFCTPGFVVSLAGYCLSNQQPEYNKAISAIDGNICRCTGYKSIEKAAARVNELLQDRKGGDPVLYAVIAKILPHYFNQIKERLYTLNAAGNGVLNGRGSNAALLAGGTDLYVQKHEEMVYADIRMLAVNPALKGITTEGDRCIIGGAATVTDVLESDHFQGNFPGLAKHVKLISSTPIRNMATIAGNFANASPIGDFTIFFLALNATLVLTLGDQKREVPLRQFYKAYKNIDKQNEEVIEQIWFELPQTKFLFNFEKVSKRTHLDIASVNSAAFFQTDGHQLTHAALSAGGVAPVPLYLADTSSYLTGKTLNETIVEEAIQIALSEVSPISDARGSAAYKKLLLAQLIKAHFITLFPALQVEKLIENCHEEY